LRRPHAAIHGPIRSLLLLHLLLHLLLLLELLVLPHQCLLLLNSPCLVCLRLLLLLWQTIARLLHAWHSVWHLLLVGHARLLRQ
jgi:hypothetical protein